MAAKVLKVKLWDDAATGSKWKKNVTEIEGEVLCGKYAPRAPAELYDDVLPLMFEQYHSSRF